jgi:hypothetical protein
MEDTRRTALLRTMQQIEEQFGKGSLTRLGGANAGHADKPLPDRPPDAV